MKREKDDQEIIEASVLGTLELTDCHRGFLLPVFSAPSKSNFLLVQRQRPFGTVASFAKLMDVSTIQQLDDEQLKTKVGDCAIWAYKLDSKSRFFAIHSDFLEKFQTQISEQKIELAPFEALEVYTLFGDAASRASSVIRVFNKWSARSTTQATGWLVHNWLKSQFRQRLAELGNRMGADEQYFSSLNALKLMPLDRGIRLDAGSATNAWLDERRPELLSMIEEYSKEIGIMGIPVKPLLPGDLLERQRSSRLGAENRLERLAVVNEEGVDFLQQQVQFNLISEIDRQLSPNWKIEIFSSTASFTAISSPRVRLDLPHQTHSVRIASQSASVARKSIPKKKHQRSELVRAFLSGSDLQLFIDVGLERVCESTPAFREHAKDPSRCILIYSREDEFHQKFLLPIERGNNLTLKRFIENDVRSIRVLAGKNRSSIPIIKELPIIIRRKIELMNYGTVIRNVVLDYPKISGIEGGITPQTGILVAFGSIGKELIRTLQQIRFSKNNLGLPTRWVLYLGENISNAEVKKITQDFASVKVIRNIVPSNDALTKSAIIFANILPEYSNLFQNVREKTIIFWEKRANVLSAVSKRRPVQLDLYDVSRASKHLEKNLEISIREYFETPEGSVKGLTGAILTGGGERQIAKELVAISLELLQPTLL